MKVLLPPPGEGGRGFLERCWAAAAAWARSRKEGERGFLVRGRSGCLLATQVWKMEMTFWTDQ